MNMKHTLSLTVCVLFFVLLLSSTSSSITKKGKKDPQLNPLVSAIPVQEDSVDKLMGMEEYCGVGDEECLRRRMMTEAHLDYIYTQHHKH
ncbi:putative phytosulfokines 6 [Hirschfeldia incana]|nr:putative phytosulfokines 6 [Hirschfeldia incana]